MARYLIVQDGGLPLPEVVEAKNLKTALMDVGNPTNEDLVAWRIANGPIKIKIRQETRTIYDILDADEAAEEESE